MQTFRLISHFQLWQNNMAFGLSSQGILLFNYREERAVIWCLVHKFILKPLRIKIMCFGGEWVKCSFFVVAISAFHKRWISFHHNWFLAVYVILNISWRCRWAWILLVIFLLWVVMLIISWGWTRIPICLFNKCVKRIFDCFARIIWQLLIPWFQPVNPFFWSLTF